MRTEFNDIFLDVSELESPLPLQTILKTLQENLNNKRLIVTHRLEPFGLYRYLNKLNLNFSCIKENDLYKITIWKKNEPND